PTNCCRCLPPSKTRPLVLWNLELGICLGFGVWDLMFGASLDLGSWSLELCNMPIFRYQVVDAKGRTLSGSMPANDEAALEQSLTKAGLWITEVAVDRPASARAVPTIAGRDARL